MLNKLRHKLIRATLPHPVHASGAGRKRTMQSTAGKMLAIAFAAALASMAFDATAQARQALPVTEVVTMKLRSGVTAAQFKAVDQGMTVNYISKRTGFLSRESAPGPGNTWLAIVHWRSAADADASMKSFSKAPGSAQFMSMIVPDSMVMTRYGW